MHAVPEGWWHAVANLAPAQGADLVDGAEPSCDGEEGSANSPAVAVGAQVAAPLEGGRLAVAQAVVPLMESGQTDAAIGLVEAALRSGPDAGSPELHLLRADLYIAAAGGGAEGAAAQAVRAYEDTIAAMPTYAQGATQAGAGAAHTSNSPATVHLKMGQALLADGREAEAAATFATAKDLDSGNRNKVKSEALLALAYIELNRGDIATGVRRAGAAAAWGAAGARELLAQVRTKADGLADTAIVHAVDTQLARPLKG